MALALVMGLASASHASGETYAEAVAPAGATHASGNALALEREVDAYVRLVAGADRDGTTRSGYEDVPDFGGPDNVGAQLREDDRKKRPFLRFPAVDRALEPWFDLKRRIRDKTGLSFGIDYSTLLLGVSESPGRDSAAGGMVRFFGSWTLVGREGKNTGSLIYKVEHRHRYGSIAPSALGFEAGYAGLIGAPFGNQGFLLTNLYWQQRFGGGRAAVQVGWLDVTDYVNVYGLASPWLHFLNLEFETGTALAIPNQGLGVVLGAMLTDQVYAHAGVADQNSDPADPGDGFDSFFNQHEYFTHLELGWVSSYDRRYFDNVHLTVWHADEREQAQVPDGWGVLLSATTFVDDRWMPFLRAGWADGDAALMQATVSAGVGLYSPEERDLVAVAIGWGRPADGALRDQYTVELFYRLQITQNLALTPDIQVVVHPALNPDEDVLVFFGLRLRLNL